MIEFSFAFTTALVITGWLLFRLGVNLKTKSFNRKREALQLLFLVNLLVLSRIVFHPMETLDGQIQPLVFDAARWWPFRTNLIPQKNMFN